MLLALFRNDIWLHVKELGFEYTIAKGTKNNIKKYLYRQDFPQDMGSSLIKSIHPEEVERILA